MCKEYTKSRNDEDSTPHASIDGYQQIGPILNVWIAKIIDVYGIEVQVPSLRNPMFPTRVLTSRGRERFVNESHLHKYTIVNQCFSLQGKEKNSNSVDQDSNKPASGNPMQGLQGSDTFCERWKSSSMHWETIASSMTMVKPACTRETGASWNDTDHVLTLSERESNRRVRNVQIFTKKGIQMMYSSLDNTSGISSK